MANYNQVYEWEGDNTQPFLQLMTWKSKKFLLPVKKTFNCARIIAEQEDREDYFALLEARQAVIGRNNAKISAETIGGAIGEEVIGSELAVNGDNLETVPVLPLYSGDFELTFKVYADEVLKFSKQIFTDKPFRLSGGFRGRTWEFEVIGNVTIRRIDVADSVQELMQSDQQ